MKRRLWLILFVLPVLLLVAAGGLWVWQAKRQEQLNQTLIAAIKANDTDAVIADLHAGADSNTRERPRLRPSYWEELRRLVMHQHDSALQGKTALEVALAFNYNARLTADLIPLSAYNDRLLNALLDAGADPNVHTADAHYPGISPLMWAVWHSSPAIVKMLLDHQTRVNEQTYNGATALMFATPENHGAIMTLLMVEHGVDVDRQDVRRRTALMGAAQNNDEDTMRILLAHHANVNLKDETDRAALWYAWAGGHSNLVRLLKQAGATE